MKTNRRSRLWLCIILACGISSTQSSQAQTGKKPDRIAYKDGDGKWQVVAVKDIEKRPAPRAGKIVKAQGGVTFNVTYLDVEQNTNIGFDDPTDGAVRRATLEAVLTSFTALLEETGQCDIEVQVSQTDGTGPLGTGGPFFFLSPGFKPGLAFRHITTGTDPLAGTPDATVTVDFGYNFNDDTGPVGPSESDLFSLLLHEITHALGFSGVIEPNGDSALDPNVYTVYDSFLYTGGGVQLINPSTFAFQAQVADLTSDNIEFRGTAASDAFGGPVPVYAPLTWDNSSLTHWDDGILPEPVMSRALTQGTEKRAHQPFETAALSDLGYQIGPKMSVRRRVWRGYK